MTIDDLTSHPILLTENEPQLSSGKEIKKQKNVLKNKKSHAETDQVQQISKKRISHWYKHIFWHFGAVLPGAG